MNAGRWLLFALAALAAAAGGARLLPPRDSDEEAWLLVLRATAAEAPLTEPREWIARSARGTPPRILTPRWWSASSPSLSYDARRFVFVARRRPSAPPEIWEMRVDGSGARRVTRGRGDPRDPVYLPDGRILYSDLARPAGARRAGAAPGARALYSCAGDGTDVRRLTFGDHVDERPQVLSDGRVRFERRPATAGAHAPALRMAVHPDGTGVAAFTGPVDGPRGDPGPEARAPEGTVTGGAVRIAARLAPPVLTSVVDPTRSTGTLLCLDAYASRLPEIAALGPGSIARVRVSAAANAEEARPAPAAEALLGEAPVHPDGSFFIEVPADTPLRLALVGRDGRELAALSSGLWVRPNENRGCLGCHEEPDRTPRNRQPLAVRETPVTLAGAAAGGGGGDGAR